MSLRRPKLEVGAKGPFHCYVLGFCPQHQCYALPCPFPCHGSFSAFREEVLDGVRLSRCLHRSVRAKRILCSRTLVGIMACINLYHIELVPSDTGVVWTFIRTVFQSVFGHSRVNRISWGFVSVRKRTCIVLYISSFCMGFLHCISRSHFSSQAAVIDSILSPRVLSPSIRMARLLADMSVRSYPRFCSRRWCVEKNTDEIEPRSPA